MFSEKGHVGQANFQKHKSGHEQTTIDNEEHAGLNWGKMILHCLSVLPEALPLVGHKKKIKFLCKKVPPMLNEWFYHLLTSVSSSLNCNNVLQRIDLRINRRRSI